MHWEQVSSRPNPALRTPIQRGRYFAAVFRIAAGHWQWHLHRVGDGLQNSGHASRERDAKRDAEAALEEATRDA